MNIEYKKGEMIVTHPSGHVDRYQQTDIDMQKATIQDQIDELKNAKVDLIIRGNKITDSVRG